MLHLFIYFCLFLSLIGTIHNGPTMIQPVGYQSWTCIVTALEYHLFLPFFFWGFLASPFALSLICSLTWYIPWYIPLHFFPEFCLQCKQYQFQEILFLFDLLHCRLFFFKLYRSSSTNFFCFSINSPLVSQVAQW